jgi:hypothetical protein
MPQVIEILANEPSQRFNITLEGQSLTMFVNWNTRANMWTMNISDDDGALVNGLALKSGVNLLEPYNFGIGNFYIVDVTNTNQEMLLTNAGIDTFLVHYGEGEL